MATSRIPITVIGAGIIGLQTARSLLQTKKYHVTIVAAHFPGDFSISYTSPWAGGQWRTYAGLSDSEREVREWEAETYAAWWEMLNSGTKDKELLEKEIGLGVREAVLLWNGEETEETRGGGKGMWWKDIVEGFDIIGAEELSGFKVDPAERDVPTFGVRYQGICINIPVYLSYVASQVRDLGAIFVRSEIPAAGSIQGLVEAVRVVPGCGDTLCVVFATGLSSRQLFGPEEAERLYPIRGQTLLVKGEARRSITYYGPMEAPGDAFYAVPRPESGGTIIGGCKQKGAWSEQVDNDLSERVLKRAKGLLPELLDQSGEFEVLSTQVGLRPGREGGPRVEKGASVGDVKVIFAYGHAGSGYQTSIGSAKKVVRMLDGYFET